MDFICSGQRRTRCFAFIVLVVVDPAVASDFALDLDPALLVRPPLGAGESVRFVRPLLLALGAGTAFGSVFVLFLSFLAGGSDPARGAGAAFGVGIVPSFFGGGFSLSAAAFGKLLLCL